MTTASATFSRAVQLASSSTKRIGAMYCRPYDHCEDALREGGFQQIGRGLYGVAFVHPDAPDRVIKFVEAQDRAWMAFINWINFHPSEHAPIIYAQHHFKGFSVVEMERLSDLTPALKHAFTIRYSKPEEVARDHDLPGTFIGWVRELRTWGEVDMGFSPDFHGGNIMMRGDVPVVTDPYTS